MRQPPPDPWRYLLSGANGAPVAATREEAVWLKEDYELSEALLRLELEAKRKRADAERRREQERYHQELMAKVDESRREDERRRAEVWAQRKRDALKNNPGLVAKHREQEREFVDAMGALISRTVSLLNSRGNPGLEDFRLPANLGSFRHTTQPLRWMRDRLQLPEFQGWTVRGYSGSFVMLPSGEVTELRLPLVNVTPVDFARQTMTTWTYPRGQGGSKMSPWVRRYPNERSESDQSDLIRHISSNREELRKSVGSDVIR